MGAPNSEPVDDLPGFGTGSKIKATRSLCPHCLKKVDAEVFEREGQVWMDKRCTDHGRFSALLASSPEHYYIAQPQVQSQGSCCGPSKHCGDQAANHSCNMLVEITQRCNLHCPTCYADASPEHTETMSLAHFNTLLDKLIGQGKGDADLIQLSGGEPTINPDMFKMIESALRRGIRQVYVNTNGIKLANPDFVRRLAVFGRRVSVYLQFDGFKPSTHLRLRGRDDLLEIKEKALAYCNEFKINTVPVMTLTQGINEDELKGFLDLTLHCPRAVNKVMIQPAMYSGRYNNPRITERITLADVARNIAEQTDGLFQEDDFSPIPCSDPNCFSMALALRTSQGLVPVSRYFPRYDSWADTKNAEMIAQVTDTFDNQEELEAMMRFALSSGALNGLPETELDKLLDRVALWQESKDGRTHGLFSIGIKPFMDAHSYDQDRIDKCCVHIISSAGEPVSFCEYNALNRPLGRV